MLYQLILAGGLIAGTVVVQAVFMSIGLGTLRSMEQNGHALLKRRPNLVVVLWILFLLVPITIDVFLWASAYKIRGALPNFDDALYFSTVTFTTVGYGDIVLDRESRILATFEAVNGWIIFGWTTAMVLIVIQRLQLPGLPR
ncbi:MAG: potassium channel family protein [Rhizobiaceae bacterium]|nr:potassium channel family protein [Rhizobiaceae bacterium]